MKEFGASEHVTLWTEVLCLQNIIEVPISLLVLNPTPSSVTSMETKIQQHTYDKIN